VTRLPRLLCRAAASARALIGILCALTTLTAVGAEALSTQLSAVKRVYQKSGTKTVEAYVPFTKALPGDLVIYTLAYTNTGDAPAADVVITLPIPGEMNFVPSSADHPDAVLSYSVDGGQTFGDLEKLTITSAAGLVRPARAEDVNALRWALSRPLPPGETGQLKYSAFLK
jgi:uncharacterized repeat protein (TIGR01451 family)